MEYKNPALPDNLYTAGSVVFDTRDIANRLYLEQRQRRMQQQKQADELNKMAQQEIGKVRSADVPDVVNAYHDFKNQAIKVSSDRQLQRDPVALANAQRDVALKHANFMQLAQSSQDRKAKDSELDKAYLNSPDKFSDDYQPLRSIANKTPISKMGEASYNGNSLDLTNDDNYMYKGSDVDWGKITKNAIGEPKQVYSESKPLDKSGLQTEVTPYHFGNSPSQIYSSILGAMGEHKNSRSAAYTLDHIPQEELKSTLDKYNATDPEKIKRTGLSELPKLEYNGNKAHDLATYLTAQAYTGSEAKAGIPTRLTNEAKKLSMEQANRQSNEALAHGYRENEIKLRESLKGKSAGDQQSSIDNYVSGIEGRAQKSPALVVEDHKTGNKTEIHPIDVSPSILKSFEKTNMNGKTIQPNAIGIGKDGKMYPLFYKKEIIKNGDDYQETGKYLKNKNGNVIDTDMSTPVSRDVFKAELSRVLLSPKATEKNLSDEDGADGSLPAPSVPSSPAVPKAVADQADQLLKKYMK